MVIITVLLSCTTNRITNNENSLGAHHISFPEMIDTRSKPIKLQKKKVYNFPNAQISFNNQFDGARLNDIIMINDSTFEVIILPENDTINESAYYAFQVSSIEKKNITIFLTYGEFHHRYIPKLSHNGTSWEVINNQRYHVNSDSTSAMIQLTTSNQTLWVAGQELKTSTMVREWCMEKSNHELVNYKVIGKSKLGRDLIFMNIGQRNELNKKVIILTCRQHPPEVSGHMAFESFVEELLRPSKLYKDFFEDYQIWVYPLLNPDGVDLGHWRHSAGGVDLNRDWAMYNQPEIKTIVNHIAKKAIDNNSNVILGIDFHSTQEDVYYTLMDTMKHKLQNFHHYWIEGIDSSLPEYNSLTEPYPLNTPISKGWFYQYFNAESITFEIGDETSREFIDLKGRAAAREMVKLLILKK